MFKTATVSFRTRQELLEMLDRVSEESKCSRSSLIETILRKFLSENAGNGTEIEKRIDVSTDIPAADEDGQSDGIVYISVGKFRLGMPKDLGYKIIFDEKKSAFQLDLLPTDESSSDDKVPLKKAGFWNGSSSILPDAKGAA